MICYAFVIEQTCIGKVRYTAIDWLTENLLSKVCVDIEYTN